ncbi:unnamed protein product [Fusarium venenatum]|uniref:Uncharacterized protein n=1 Tax=Fusarium venenatum TaxID=56646 RepID=A0A2L2TPM4_9HYPO|nr:uncharacterized protein FVRRES_05851 [Fusarium venenatum]KAH6992892.1 hypothetical protein EDB82DRAFT_474678 [Fusarium venenatum]CEI61415.1 unnamed protein product [Fusarium venenatum]
MKGVYVRTAPFRSLIQDDGEKDWDATSCSTCYLSVLYTSLFNGAAWVQTKQSFENVNKQTSTRSPLPTRPSLDVTTNTNSLERGPSLGFPECVCVNAKLCPPGLPPLSIPYKSPIFSFSDLSFTLISANRTGEKPNSEGYLETQSLRVSRLSDNMAFLTGVLKYPYTARLRPNTTLQVFTGRMDTPEQMPISVSCSIKAEYLLEEICLQRAFGMFEDGRFYPGGKSIIPSLKNLQRLADDTWLSFGVSKDGRNFDIQKYPGWFW